LEAFIFALLKCKGNRMKLAKGQVNYPKGEQLSNFSLKCNFQNSFFAIYGPDS